MTTFFSSILKNDKTDMNGKVPGATQRIDDLMGPLFNDDALRVVQEGVHHMFHVCRDIAAPRDPALRMPQKDLIDRLNTMEKEKWERIRVSILDSKLHDYKDGKNYSDDENKMPVKIMYDMMHIMSHLKRHIDGKLSEYYNTEERLRNDIKQVHSTLAETQSELTDVRWNYKKDKATLNTIESRIKHLECVNKEKTEKIEELQRQDNVQLWQKENARVLTKTKEKEAQQAAEIEKLTREKNALQKKFEMADQQLKIQKLRSEVGSKLTGISQEASADELKKAKQHIYVLEKDLRSMETELFNQQKYMIGLLKGIKDDYWSAWDGVMTEETVPLPTVRKGRQLGLRMTSIFEAAALGKLGSIRADLPDHYLATDHEINRVSVKKLSSAYGVKLSPKPKRKNGVADEERNGKKDPLDLLEEKDQLPNLTGMPLSTNKSTSKRRSTMLPEGTLLGYTRTGRRKSSVLPDEHPTLVNPKTGFVNMIAVMRFFPYMTKEYVSEQWGHYRAYDTNGDGDLDLPEMMNAMTNTVGEEFTAAQVKDAMHEVDLDGSDTIDFFEYLSIAHLLLEKKGRSEVFRSKIAREEGRHVSKTCVVQ